MHSSTSIAMRFRNSIVVGFMRTSPSEIVGNSSGKPPADSAPRFTASATCRRCALQVVSSDHEFAMPIPGIQVLNAEKTAGEAKALGRKVLAMKCDVTSSADVKLMVDRTRDVLGRIDVLVNNAGMASPPGMPFMNNTEEDWDRTFAVNTKSVFLTCKAVTPYFLERKAGRIINIASIAGPLAAVTMPAYSVAKQGVITFTRVVAKELAPHRITVNAICPGVLYTDFWQKLAQHIADTNPAFKGMTARQVFEKRVADIVPMKCEQTPEDIGNAAVFLASDEARYITGQALMVDGGCVMW